MLQLTLNLDTETQARIETAARAANLSVEQWITHWLRTTTTETTIDSHHLSTPDNSWPTEVRDLAGAWPDFPTLEEIRSGQGEDSQRESL